MFTRNFSLILIANIIMGAAMPMLVILGVLAGAALAPSPFLATVPPSVQMLAGILVATPISVFMGRYGRKSGFLGGAVLMIVAGSIGATAMITGSFLLLCAAHFLLGAALVCVNYFRFAASESVGEGYKATAISLTLASGIVAAYVGPAVFSASNDMLAPVAFAGAYLAISALGLMGVLPVLLLTGVMKTGVRRTGVANAAAWRALLRRPQVAFAIGAAALSQAIMVLLMVPTPLAMIGCGFDQSLAGDVIRWHVIAMFAPGFVTGPLIRRFGVVVIITIGLLILGLSAVVALFGLELWNFYGALVLLGIGWNFGFIGGTHMLQSVLSAKERPLIQGLNDTLLAVASFSASLLSGAIYGGLGWLAIVGASLPVLGIAGLGLWGLMRKIRADN